MALHFEGSKGWVETTEEYQEGRMAVIAERIGVILEYGPLVIGTSYPGIPDQEYRFSGAYSPEVTTLEGENLSVDGSGESTSINFDVPELAWPLNIGLGHIEYADVGHALGRNMPLHGRRVPAPVVLKRDGVTLMEWAPRFIEYGTYARAEATTHPNYRNVGIVRLYTADVFDEQFNELPPIDLEGAKAASSAEGGFPPAVFLISRLSESRRAIVTSKIGYDETRSIIVRPPESMGNEPIAVEMLDVKDGMSEDEMLERHIKRLESWHVKGNPRYPALSDMERDEIFLYITSD